MRNFLFIVLLVIVGTLELSAQQTGQIVLEARVIEGDTVPVVNLGEIEVYSLVIPRSKRGQRKLSKLVKNVKKVYPYARLAGIKLAEYEVILLQAPDERARRKIMKQAEEEIKEEYGEELKNLTFSQGKILIKLLDRETGNSSYELVQELRGKFTAFWYQAFAKIWGYNLKVKYDPDGEDRQLETIVRMIERGQI